MPNRQAAVEERSWRIDPTAETFLRDLLVSLPVFEGSRITVLGIGGSIFFAKHGIIAFIMVLSSC